jgi:hypothetical protein
MFSKLGGVLVDGNNCHVMTPDEIRAEKVLNTYLVPGEKTYVMLKSAQEEYIFTERAFISVKGESSLGTKRNVNRYNFFDWTVTSVFLNTPGMNRCIFHIIFVFSQLYFQASELPILTEP